MAKLWRKCTMVSFIWKMQIKISLRFCLTLVFQGNLCEGSSGACLSTDQLPQPGFSLDGAVGDPHHETRQVGRSPAQWSPCQGQSPSGEPSCFPPRWWLYWLLLEGQVVFWQAGLLCLQLSSQARPGRGLCLFSCVVSSLSLWASVTSPGPRWTG